MASSQQTAFRKATVSTHKLSRHSLASEHITSGTFGQLIPIYTAPMAPGSTFHYKPKIYIRTPALQVATFGQIRVKQYSFFVPFRLLWDKWNDFVARGFDESFSFPYFTLDQLLALTLCEKLDSTGNMNDVFADMISQNYASFLRTYFASPKDYYHRGEYTTLSSNLGLNLFAGIDVANYDYDGLFFVNSDQGHKSVLPFRAYQQIWWDWFRDSVQVPDTAKYFYCHFDSGKQLDIDFLNPSAIQIDGEKSQQFRVRRACYSKDFFTTAKTSPQYGQAPLVPVNIGVDVNPNLVGLSVPLDEGFISFSDGDSDGEYPPQVTNRTYLTSESSENIGQFSINTFRYYNALQEYLEQLNIGGTRPIEVLLAQYGVVSDAVREDMAEFVGGDDRLLDIVMVTQTAETSEGSLGDNSAYGKVYMESGSQSYSAKEFGIFMSLMYIEPVTGYCDGIPAMFDWIDREDYFMDKFENTGYDAIPVRRLFDPLFSISSGKFNVDDAFGFQPRYSDWKFQRDVLGGDFIRPNTVVGNDSYHTFRRFYRRPYLNSEFSQINVSNYGNNWMRLFVKTTDDYDPFSINVTNENNAVLPMEGFASPALSAIYASSGKKVSIPYGGVRL